MEILNKKLLRLSLQFFAEGAGDGGAEGEGAAEAESTSGYSDGVDDVWMAEMEQKYGITNGVASAQARAAVEAGRSVAHSEEAEDADADTDKDSGTDADATDTAEPGGEKSPEEEFDELIKSDKFKGVYGKRLAGAVNERFKNQNDARAEADKYRGALQSFAAKYGKSADDIDGIIAAIAADDSLLEDEAYKSGKSVETIRAERVAAVKEAESSAELARLKAELKGYKDREDARATATVWAEQARETKKLYGDNFDLTKELKNPEFLKYLQRDGKTVTEAFEMTHYKEIMASQLKAVERRADENAAKTVMANKGRIRESATAHRAASDSPRIDLRNMNDADFDRIDEMLARGEKITADYFR